MKASKWSVAEIWGFHVTKLDKIMCDSVQDSDSEESFKTAIFLILQSPF